MVRLTLANVNVDVNVNVNVNAHVNANVSVNFTANVRVNEAFKTKTQGLGADVGRILYHFGIILEFRRPPKSEFEREPVFYRVLVAF